MFYPFFRCCCSQQEVTQVSSAGDHFFICSKFQMGLLQFLRVFVFGRLMYPTKRNCCPLKKCVCQRIIFPLICNGNHSSRRWHSHPEATFVEKVFLNRKCLSSLDKGNPLRLDGFAAARIAEKGNRNNQKTCFHFPDLKKYL